MNPRYLPKAEEDGIFSVVVRVARSLGVTILEKIIFDLD